MAILGVGLLPAGLGDAANHAAAQFVMTLGSIGGVFLLACGIARLQGQEYSDVRIWTILAGICVANYGALAAGPWAFGQFFAVCLAAAITLMTWHGRGFLLSPRSRLERLLGLALFGATIVAWLRVGFTWRYVGPPLTHLIYMPKPLDGMLAIFYGMLPMTIATLMLSLVNTRLSEQLRVWAATDELTGTLTRRALRELAPSLIARRREQGGESAVMILDLDHFKTVNDSYGHAAGDKVLKLAAEALRGVLRRDSLLARYGGEEFVALVPVDDLPSARRVSERLRRAVLHTDWTREAGLNRPVTTSVGVAIIGPGEDLEHALQRADGALYRAKGEGRNQVQVSLAAA